MQSFVVTKATTHKQQRNEESNFVASSQAGSD